MKTQKSNRQKTTRRKTTKNITFIRFSFFVLGSVIPSIAGLWAYRIWFSTRRYQEPQRETRWRETAITTTLPDSHGTLQVYNWDNKKSTKYKVLLLHGWNGRGCQMAAFVKPLQKAGFQVVTFDAPGHGRTPGTQSNLFRVVNALTTVEKEMGPFDFVIAHSFGAMVLARALKEGLTINKAVCVSSPATSTFLIDQFSQFLRLSTASRKNLLQRIYNRFGEDIWSRLSTLDNARLLTTPALIVHDNNDFAVPVSHAKLLSSSWPNSQLLITSGLGHNQILRDKKTIQSIVDYLCSD